MIPFLEAYTIQVQKHQDRVKFLNISIRLKTLLVEGNRTRMASFFMKCISITPMGKY